METVILTIEITAALDKELQEIADRDLVTKEDIARGIIAVHLAKAKENKSNFGIDLVAEIFQGIGAAMKMTKHQQQATLNILKLQKQEPVKPRDQVPFGPKD